jgi:hypothetical protein
MVKGAPFAMVYITPSVDSSINTFGLLEEEGALLKVIVYP